MSARWQVILAEANMEIVEAANSKRKCLDKAKEKANIIM